MVCDMQDTAPPTEVLDASVHARKVAAALGLPLGPAVPEPGGRYVVVIDSDDAADDLEVPSDPEDAYEVAAAVAWCLPAVALERLCDRDVPVLLGLPTESDLAGASRAANAHLASYAATWTSLEAVLARPRALPNNTPPELVPGEAS